MKRKVIAVALLLCVLAVTVTGTTIAYFTDTKTQTNVFTTGDVKILFTENGEELTGAVTRFDYGRVSPGMTVQKDSTVTVIGSEAAYLATRIRITDGDGDIRRALVYPWETPTGGKAYVTSLFEGGMLEGLTAVADRSGYYENATYLVYFDTSVAEGFLITVYVKDVQAPNSSLSLLHKISFPAAWDHRQMMECEELQIELQIFATQATGFGDCEQAMAEAFDDVF